jgi:predicted MFS family arabinose efflux permease
MQHIPVNHHLRAFWRTLAGLCGLYVLVFGCIAITRTTGRSFFARHDLQSTLGLRANSAFAVLSIVAGVVIVAGAIIGGNLDRWINLVTGIIFMLAGIVMVALLNTSFNYLGFTVSTVVVSFVFGLFMFTAGLYGKVGSGTQHHQEENFRHGGPDPHEHVWTFKGGPKPPHQTDDHRFA